MAWELNLRPVGQTEAFGIGGAGMFEMVSANMLLYVGDAGGSRVTIGLFKDFVCAPGLRESHYVYNLTAPASPSRWRSRAAPRSFLMDINMPVMDGLAAARVIRQLRGRCGVTIIAFSAHGAAHRRQALDAGCDEYVSKDKGVSQLAVVVRRYLAPA